MLSMNSLNAAMSSYSMLKTVSSVRNQNERRNEVLRAEIKTGNGNLEAKQEEIAENNENIQKLDKQLYENMDNINKAVNKPMTEEEKEALREEKADAKKQAEKEAEKKAAEKAATEGTPISTTASVHPADQADQITSQAAVVAAELTSPVDAALIYDASGTSAAAPALEAVGQIVDVNA